MRNLYCTASRTIVPRSIPAMKKNERIEALIASLGPAAEGLHPCYAGWFACFNAGDYYEAHDVLEHLWLRTDGTNHSFYKGLIQLAGAFVHLKKHRERPGHPKDGARLRPAGRLFKLALKNLAPYAPDHLRLDVREVCTLCEQYLRALESGGFAANPWNPGATPAISPRPA